MQEQEPTAQVRVRTLREFERQAKRLKRKYPSLQTEVPALIASLQLNLAQGTDVGGGTLKIRLKIASKGRGKSGGARVVTYLTWQLDALVLLTSTTKAKRPA